MSAMPCGCDHEANPPHLCEWHLEEQRDALMSVDEREPDEDHPEGVE